MAYSKKPTKDVKKLNIAWKVYVTVGMAVMLIVVVGAVGWVMNNIYMALVLACGILWWFHYLVKIDIKQIIEKRKAKK